MAGAFVLGSWQTLDRIDVERYSFQVCRISMQDDGNESSQRLKLDYEKLSVQAGSGRTSKNNFHDVLEYLHVLGLERFVFSLNSVRALVDQLTSCTDETRHDCLSIERELIMLSRMSIFLRPIVKEATLSGKAT